MSRTFLSKCSASYANSLSRLYVCIARMIVVNIWSILDSTELDSTKLNYLQNNIIMEHHFQYNIVKLYYLIIFNYIVFMNYVFLKILDKKIVCWTFHLLFLHYSNIIALFNCPYFQFCRRAQANLPPVCWIDGDMFWMKIKWFFYACYDSCFEIPKKNWSNAYQMI